MERPRETPDRPREILAHMHRPAKKAAPQTYLNEGDRRLGVVALHDVLLLLELVVEGLLLHLDARRQGQAGAAMHTHTHLVQAEPGAGQG